MVITRRTAFFPTITLLCAASLGACAAQTPAPSEPAPTSAPAVDDADQAPEFDERRAKLLAELEAERAADPGAGEPRYALARFYANTGAPERSLALLRELVAIASWDLAPEPDDFGELAQREEFQRLTSALAARVEPMTPSPVAFELDALDLAPEGVAWDAKRGRLLVGSMHQRAVRWADNTGVTRVLVAPAQDGLLGVLGIEVEASADTLWVASAVAPFMQGYDDGLAGRSAVYAFSLEDGRTLGRWEPPSGPALLNDLTVTADNEVYVTESMGGGVLRRPAGEPSGALRPFVAAGTFIGANGIVTSPDDAAIYVCDLHGVHRVDRASGVITKLEPPAGVSTLGGIDGLDRRGSTLVGVQNLFSPGRIWALQLDVEGRAVTGATRLDDNHPRYKGPTTGAVAGDRFLYLANASLQISGSTMGPAPAGARHVILGPALP